MYFCLIKYFNTNYMKHFFFLTIFMFPHIMSGQWSQIGQTLIGDNQSDQFGFSVAWHNRKAIFCDFCDWFCGFCELLCKGKQSNQSAWRFNQGWIFPISPSINTVIFGKINKIL